jgi:pimeloyl-ACP methyl ester carboxylesterase
LNTISTSPGRPDVLFVPGGVTPAEPSYAPLLQVMGAEIQPHLKDLELYAAEAPAPDYSLQSEADGNERCADAAGAERFHLVAYSGGGACALAYVAQHPERVASLALIEPAWIGVVAAEDAELWAELGHIMTLPATEQMPPFMRWHMRPGAEPPKPPTPSGPPPAWMAKRPAGLHALMRTDRKSVV